MNPKHEIFQAGYKPPKQSDNNPHYLICNNDRFFNDLPRLERKELKKRCSVNFLTYSVKEMRVDELLARAEH